MIPGEKMVEKHFRNLEEQIEILKNKGLKINNESYAKDVLLRENYFFLNGYRYLFMYSNTDKRFLENTTFEELYSMFLFDRNIRNIIFKNLLIIEKYGYKERDYLKEKNFTRRPEKKKQVKDLISKMQRQIRINSRDHTATMHYADNYGYIPMWILVKVLSFGIVSEMYSILKDDDQIQIAKVYHVSPDSLITYLPILANYRNLCAHEDILFDNKTQKQIEDTIYHQLLNIQKEEDEYIYGKCDLFSLLIIMKELLVNEEFKSMIIELENAVNTLDYNLSTIKVEKVLHKMGFPLNWYELKNMERSYLNE